jgi:hypothetical protein
MILRTKIFIRLVYLLFSTAILQKHHGVFYKSCGFCKGVRHTKLSYLEDDIGNYESEFKCSQCGAIGKTKEKWIKEID